MDETTSPAPTAAERFMALIGKPAPVFPPGFEELYRAKMDAADADLRARIARRKHDAA